MGGILIMDRIRENKINIFFGGIMSILKNQGVDYE